MHSVTVLELKLQLSYAELGGMPVLVCVTRRREPLWANIFKLAQVEVEEEEAIVQHTDIFFSIIEENIGVEMLTG